MARTTLVVTTSTASGTVLPAAAAVDAVNGNQFANATGRAAVEVTNGSGSSITATFITTAQPVYGGVSYALADDPVAIAAGASKICGPFDKSAYNDGSGNVAVDWSSGTSVTARVVELGAG
jgi:hypothetical protein